MRWWLWFMVGWITLLPELVMATIVSRLDFMCLYQVANPLRHVTAGYINWFLAHEPQGRKHESITDSH